MIHDNRRAALELALGLMLIQALDIAASWQIHAGSIFSRSVGDALFIVDASTTAIFIVLAIVLVIEVFRGKESSINRNAASSLVMATLQVSLNVGLLVTAGRTRSDSLLWGLWDLGAAYLLIVVVFTGWYWLCDRTIPGGAFDFPERSRRPDHRATVIDYLFIAFNTNSTFGPTSETVLSRRVKVLMMYQTILSLAILLVFVARITGLSD